MGSYLLAVDLGTTKTAAAIARDGRVTVVGLGQRDVTIPTVLLVQADGSVLVGEAALRRAVEAPERVVHEVKRRVGDDTPLLVAGSPWAAELLLARVLRHVVDRVNEEQAAAPDRVVLTHPANWGRYKLDLLVQAARQVGVEPVELVPEPVAAAAWYAADHRVPDGGHVAVYDLGGGTFDATVVRHQGDHFEMLGVPDGVERFGGADIDAAVLGRVTDQLGEAWTSLTVGDPEVTADVLDLRARCVEAKEALSVDTVAMIPVRLPTVRTTVRLTRAELEAMVRGPLGETIVALERTIRSAGLTMADLHAVLLVGGASRMPLVADLVTAATGVPVAVDVNPRLAAAQGAALLASGNAVALAPVAAVPPSAPPPPPPPPLVPAPPPLVPAPPIAPPGSRGRRRWVPAAAVVGVALLAGGAALALGGGGDGGGRDDGVDGAEASSSTSVTSSATSEASSVTTSEATATTSLPVGDGVLRVGVLVPAPGSDLAFLGPPMEAAAMLAAEDLNQAGGVLGEPVEVLVNSDVAALATAGADLVIGPVDLGDVGAVVDALDANGMAGCASHGVDIDALAGDGGRYVRTVPFQGVGAQALARAIEDDGHNNVGVVSASDQPAYRDALLGALHDAGIDTEVEIDVDPAAFDPVEIVNRLNASGIDAAVLIGGDEFVEVVRVGAAAGFLRFYGDESLESDIVGNRVADVLASGIEFSIVSADPAPPGRVTDEIAVRTGGFPFAAPYVYRCVLLAATAAETAGDDAGDAIVDSWIEVSRTVETCGVEACVELDDDGETVSGSFDVWRWLQNGTKEHVRDIEV